jgi:hypothetical protein
MTFDLDRLQIEHVMPPAWQEHWLLQDGADLLHAHGPSTASAT